MHVDVGDGDRNFFILTELIESALPIGGADHVAAEVFQHIGENCEDGGIIVTTRTERGIIELFFLPASTQRVLLLDVPGRNTYSIPSSVIANSISCSACLTR
jgi:hypothetical protein